ncbi:MAG: radical SAM protein [Candidatus Levybacteria bacterium]|nr:radical SAM protein [Candidatus Levybacteria bacterium]
MQATQWRQAYLRLHPQAALKSLEKPFIYHIGRDELYEIDDRAQDFLSHCDGSHQGEELTADAAFVVYCAEEELLELLPYPDPNKLTVNRTVHPSLRYLEVQLLHRCNLRCLHCYLEPAPDDELALADAIDITRQFSALGGLRLMISGGEPVLYKDLKQFLALTADLQVRRVLLSNGTLINADNIGWLNVEEIQFSLDGWTEGHDLLRGAGTLARTIQGMRIAKESGMAVSVATMIHRGNLNEFERMRDFIDEIGVVEWGIDLPVPTGSLQVHRELLVPYAEAAPLMAYAYGGGYHGSSDGFACGRHLLTVRPDGQAVKCGFYSSQLLGDARRSLYDCWRQLEHISLDRLECRDCPVLADCAGGCRFRAAHPLAPDPLMCAVYGVSP